MSLDPHTLVTSLADSTRLRIIFLLTTKGELCVCEIVSALETHQPKVSKHLAVLRNNGIIASRRVGQWIYYRINQELPTWATLTINHLTDGCSSREPYLKDLEKLPESDAACS